MGRSPRPLERVALGAVIEFHRLRIRATWTRGHVSTKHFSTEEVLRQRCGFLHLNSLLLAVSRARSSRSFASVSRKLFFTTPSVSRVATRTPQLAGEGVEPALIRFEES